MPGSSLVELLHLPPPPPLRHSLGVGHAPPSRVPLERRNAAEKRRVVLAGRGVLLCFERGRGSPQGLPRHHHSVHLKAVGGPHLLLALLPNRRVEKRHPNPAVPEAKADLDAHRPTAEDGRSREIPVPHDGERPQLSGGELSQRHTAHLTPPGRLQLVRHHQSLGVSGGGSHLHCCHYLALLVAHLTVRLPHPIPPPFREQLEHPPLTLLLLPQLPFLLRRSLHRNLLAGRSRSRRRDGRCG
mmetsp:Transcript_51866/g.123555  ORF Transcript_51866/g.123555 Transcript_51866/m.123555 type:complete len:242 (-) Transcript_51866:154-879(-)